MLTKKEYEEKQMEIIRQLSNQRDSFRIPKKKLNKSKGQISFTDIPNDNYYGTLQFIKNEVVFEAGPLIVSKYPNIDNPKQFHQFNLFVDNCMNIFELRYGKHKKEYKNKPIYIIDYIENDGK